MGQAASGTACWEMRFFTPSVPNLLPQSELTLKTIIPLKKRQEEQLKLFLMENLGRVSQNLIPAVKIKRCVFWRDSPWTRNRMTHHWRWTPSSGSSPSLSLCRRVRLLRMDGWTRWAGSRRTNGFWSMRRCFLLRSCPSGTRWETGALRSHTEPTVTLPVCPDKDG